MYVCVCVCVCTCVFLYINTHPVEYYSAIKNEMMPLAATCVDLQMIILNEVNQTNTTRYHLYV